MLRNSYGLKPEQLQQVLETAVGGLEVPGSGSPSVTNTKKTAEENRLVALVHSRVKESEQNMWPYYKKWGLNTEYYADNPFAGWNPNNKSIVKHPGKRGAGHAAQHLHPVSYNLFKSSVNAIVARFAATRPQIIIRPGSTTEEVVEAARVAQRVVAEHEWERQGMEEVLAEAVPNLILHGTTVLKVTWNPKGGKYLGKNPVPAIGQDGNPIQGQEYDPITGSIRGSVDEDGNPMWSPEVGDDGEPVLEHEWEGQAETCVVLARDFMVDNAARSYRTARWCIHKYEMSPTDIYDMYEKEVGFGSGSEDETAQYGFTRRQDTAGGKQTVTVYELWLKPGTYKFGPNPSDKVTFENGFVVISTEDTLLDAGPNPNDHGKFPFVFIPALRIPGELYGDTVANSLRMLQNSFNKTGSQIVMANDLAGNPSWLLPNGCKMPDGDRINKAAVFRRYEAGLSGEKPEMIPGTGVGPSVWRYWDSLRGLFQEISGVMEGGMGGGSGGVESGRALNALVERDVSKLASIGLEIGRGLKAWSWLVLQVIQQHWEAPRSINVVGHYQVSEVVSFGAVDVHDSFEVTVAPESVMPQTQALRQAKAADLLDRGIIKPYDYLKRVGEDSAEEFTTESLDVANARMENASARRHGVVPIMATPEHMEVEDHSLHMEEHRRELLNPSLRRDPAKWQALHEHYKFHEELTQRAAEQALAAQEQQVQAMNPSPQGQEGPGSPTPPPTTGGPLPLG